MVWIDLQDDRRGLVGRRYCGVVFCFALNRLANGWLDSVCFSAHRDLTLIFPKHFRLLWLNRRSLPLSITITYIVWHGLMDLRKMF